MIKNRLFIIIILFFIWACDKEIPEFKDLQSLQIHPSYDTIQIYENNYYKELGLTGIFENEVTNTIYNKGVISVAKYTITSVKTSYSGISNKHAVWYSTNEEVAIITDGRIIPYGKGYTDIFAEINDIRSDTITVEVLQVNEVPEIIIFMPLIVLVFEDSVIISGRTIENSNIEIQNAIIISDDEGNFSYTYNNLSEGINIIEIFVYNPNDEAIYNKKNITINYIPYKSQLASEIAGRWIIMLENDTFNFEITKDNSEYIFEGTINTEFELLGEIENIYFSGRVMEDGSLDAIINYTQDDIKLIGDITAQFTSTTALQGEVKISAVQKGWIELIYSNIFSGMKE